MEVSPTHTHTMNESLVFSKANGDEFLIDCSMFIAAARRLRVLRSSDLNASTVSEISGFLLLFLEKFDRF
jgi:hypothetical protein